ncbi:MAG TPA: 50S ribosomal protein L22 [Planctomycetota bacterium]|jgi:large subunit ribosomal protein L22|nr:50S ribosomal protein L22 [Planctomycetota bacterium]
MSAVKEFSARHRFAHITARKARYVADLIRGRSVNEALELLQFTPNRGSTFYVKVLRSAIANASHDEAVNINRLFVSECRADDGPLLQNRLRYRPGPQGRAMPFAKRMSHLLVKVREIDGADPRKKGSIDEPAAEASAPETPTKGKKAAPKKKKAAPAQAKTAGKPAKKPAKGKKSEGEGKKA